MKEWVAEFRRALTAVALLAIVLCGIYPLAVWGIGQLLFPEKANGSMLVGGKKIVGSSLIAQPFTSPAYFHPRPSAVAYAGSGANSGGSNLGPLSRLLNEQVTTRIKKYRQENGLADAFPVAAGAVSASASGLDPHISPDDACAQAARVARARGVSKARILQMIQRCTEARQLGIFGEKRVNVLLLNLELAEQK